MPRIKTKRLCYCQPLGYSWRCIPMTAIGWRLLQWENIISRIMPTQNMHSPAPTRRKLSIRKDEQNIQTLLEIPRGLRGYTISQCTNPKCLMVYCLSMYVSIEKSRLLVITGRGMIILTDTNLTRCELMSLWSNLGSDHQRSPVNHAWQKKSMVKIIWHSHDPRRSTLTVGIISIT